MTVKEYLGQIRKLTSRIKRIDEEIERNRLMLLPGAIRYDVDRVQTSPEDKLAEYAAAFDALAQRQAKEMLKLARKRDRIIHQLNSMEHQPMADLLYHRYVELLSWREIAEVLHYSSDWVRHMHAEALEEFDREILKRQHKKTHRGMV